MLGVTEISLRTKDEEEVRLMRNRLQSESKYALAQSNNETGHR